MVDVNIQATKEETPGRGNETNSRNIEKTQKRIKTHMTLTIG